MTATWIKTKIGKAGLVENEDYVVLTQKGEQIETRGGGAKYSTEYLLTITAGKLRQ